MGKWIRPTGWERCRCQSYHASGNCGNAAAATLRKQDKEARTEISSELVSDHKTVPTPPPPPNHCLVLSREWGSLKGSSKGSFKGYYKGYYRGYLGFLVDCLVLRREWGNGLWTIGIHSPIPY